MHRESFKLWLCASKTNSMVEVVASRDAFKGSRWEFFIALQCGNIKWWHNAFLGLREETGTGLPPSPLKTSLSSSNPFFKQKRSSSSHHHGLPAPSLSPSIEAATPAPTGSVSKESQEIHFLPGWKITKAFLMTGLSSCHLPATSLVSYY